MAKKITSRLLKISNIYKLNHVSFSVPKLKFYMSYLSYKNLSHSLLTSSDGNMWPPFEPMRASVGRAVWLLQFFRPPSVPFQENWFGFPTSSRWTHMTCPMSYTYFHFSKTVPLQS